MVDAASAGEAREQTLLEAAKAYAEAMKAWAGSSWDNSPALGRLRAAIAREEAKPSALAYLEDRAQQAEASAAWWKAEGERLSAELALAKNQMTLAIERSERLSGQLRGCEYDLGQTGKLRNRAEKAEAELAKAKSDTRAKIQSELRSIERALCSADVLDEFAALSRDAYSCHVHNTIETAISALRDDAATPPYLPPFEGDPKACAFTHGAFSSPSDSRPSPEAPSPSDGMRGSREHRAGCVPTEPKVGIVRDPVTGWTFDTMRQQFDAARTTVRVLAAELVAARQQIAGTKGFVQ